MAVLELSTVIDNIHDLPSLPAVVMSLLNLVDQDDADISVLAEKVSQDLALTAKTLRLANSAFFVTRVKVTTIQQAITLLGFQHVRTMIIMAALTGCFPERTCPGFDHKQFWEHSTAAATAAGILARHIGMQADIAVTAALLHDIGRLVLVTCFPQEYAAALAYRKQNDCTMLEAEVAIFGIDHAAAGALLATNWHFSDVMRLAIEGHHAPDRPGAGFLAALVHIANAIVHQLASTEEGQQASSAVSQTAWTALNLDDDVYAGLCQRTQESIDRQRGAQNA